MRPELRYALFGLRSVGVGRRAHVALQAAETPADRANSAAHAMGKGIKPEFQINPRLAALQAHTRSSAEIYRAGSSPSKSQAPGCNFEYPIIAGGTARHSDPGIPRRAASRGISSRAGSPDWPRKPAGD